MKMKKARPSGRALEKTNNHYGFILTVLVVVDDPAALLVVVDQSVAGWLAML